MSVSWTSTALALVAVLVTVCVHCAKTQVSSTSQCSSSFDFYFVLDGSGSMSGHFRKEVANFVRNVTDLLTSPNLRISFIIFNSDAEVVLELTSDRSLVASGITYLENYTPDGSTHLSPGLMEVNNQLDKYGRSTTSIVLTITDGHIADAEDALQQADHIRQKGGSLFAIGVSNADEQQLAMFADGKENVFIGADFDFLDSIVDSVVEETCIEITSADPLSVCQQETDNTNITLTGRGLNHTLTPEKIACRFVYDNEHYETSKPVGPVRSNKLVCKLPTFNISGPVLLQVTLNGITYITSNVTVTVNECQPPSAALAAGLFFGLLALIIMIALLLLWIFFPIIMGVKVVKVPDDPEEDTPKAPRKWDVVDTSYYGGGGVGGIKPVMVHWGGKGATEEGSKLTVAKDATVIEVKEEPAIPKSPRPAISCWTAFKKKVFRGYAVIASYRPVRGQETFIVWFPQSHSTPQKYKKANMSKKLSVTMESVDGVVKTRSTGNQHKMVSISRPAPPRPSTGKETLPRAETASKPSPPRPTRPKATSLSRPPPPRPPAPRGNRAQTLNTASPRSLQCESSQD